MEDSLKLDVKMVDVLKLIILMVNVKILNPYGRYIKREGLNKTINNI